MVRLTKRYNYGMIEGCVSQTVNRKTNTLIGVYNSYQSGLESEEELPWVTVCEDHSSIVGHKTLANARGWAVDPTVWCHACGEQEVSC